MKRSITVFLLVTVSLWVVEASKNAGLSSAITSSDLNNIKSSVLSHTDKGWPDDIHSAFYVSSALANLDKVPKQTEVCNLAKNILSSKGKQDVESIYHAVGVVETLKCDGVSVDKSVVEVLRKSIDDGDSLTDLYYAGSAALSLRSSKISTEIAESDLTSLVGKVTEFADEDGTFHPSSDKDGSLYYSGLALQILARLAKETKLSDDDQTEIDSVVDKVESIVSLGDEEGGMLAFTSSDDAANPLTTTSAVLVGLSAFTSAIKRPLRDAITPAHITQIGEYLVSHKHVGTLHDIYHLLAGLHALQNNVIGVPLVVSLERSSIVGTAKGAEGHLRVRVTDVFDKPIPAAKVYLIKAHPVGKDSHVLLSNQELTLADDKQAYSINFLAAKPDQGFYSLEYRVVPTDNKYTTIDSAARTVKVVGSITITDLDIAVADSKEALNKASEGNRYKAADETHKIDEVIRIDHLQFVNVKFRVRNAVGSNKPLFVQQAFVKFTHIKSGHEAIFVAQQNENKGYSVNIDVEEAAKSQFKSLSGDYKLEIIAGDSFIQNPIHWVASTSVKFTFVAAAPTNTRNSLGPLPEIKHQFREPESRPLAAVSTVFTFIILAPLAVLFIGFIALGANISHFPFSGADFIYAVGFIGSIGAILALMGLYWLKLNLVQTLGYLAVLAVPTVFFGQRALSQIARRKSKVE